jgi:hypothetical protein
MSYTVKTIDELESIHHAIVKLAGAELGIRSFGMQVVDFPAGFSEYPEHGLPRTGRRRSTSSSAGAPTSSSMAST